MRTLESEGRRRWRDSFDVVQCLSNRSATGIFALDQKTKQEKDI
jgi:hypothetical protein